MNNAGSQLLDLLTSGVRRPMPVAPAKAVREMAQSGPNFAELLAQARTGDISSGLRVEADPALELSDTQLGRIATAADRAEAAGAERAVVLIDGKMLELDINSRRVVGEVELEPGQMLDRIGAVLRVPDEPGAIRHASTDPIPFALRALTHAGSASMLDALGAGTSIRTPGGAPGDLNRGIH